MKRSTAEIVREYGPFPGLDRVHGVTYDGQHVWFASGDKLNAFDPASGKMLRSIDVAAHAGTAFDGKHLFQIAEDRIQKIDPKTGRCSPPSRRPAPAVTLGSRGPKARSGSGSIATGRSIRSIPRPARFFAPSSPTASSPASPGSTENSGTAPGKATRAICGESILRPEKCWRASRCRRESTFPGSSPMAAIGSSAEEKRPGRSERSAGRDEAPRTVSALSTLSNPDPNTNHVLADRVSAEDSHGNARLELSDQHGNSCHAADDLSLLGIAKGTNRNWRFRVWDKQ